MKKIFALSFADARNVVRDSTLILVLFGPIGVFAFLRFVVPLIADHLAAERTFDLWDHCPFIVSFMSLLPSMLFGLIFGFIILDERDEDIISFIAVTPLRKSGYLSYKLLASVLMSFIFFFIIVYLSGLITLPIKYAFALAVMVALEAPMVALFLAAFAVNKVEGLAFSKMLGVMYLAPFVAYFVESNWQYLAGIFPPFWVTKAFLAAKDNTSLSYWVFIAAGLTTHLGVIGLFLKRFVDNQR
ncbi:ABC transporter permease [candidate division KSB1 bacterium]|nr:ABC transporter permease [candidate division KSB1 bacterium]NIR68900.1 ABC transporter permease [candidate division KSB1 bacterium]NIS24025.1 ABC transporter permease [candidate division KSB1 bacterium]NIT73189.1 ABC transporter permease [candidate division KSB1 bacterium]NIU24675.1 ABC transporter permease [candidate division KSB1 bacterium]